MYTPCDFDSLLFSGWQLSIINQVHFVLSRFPFLDGSNIWYAEPTDQLGAIGNCWLSQYQRRIDLFKWQDKNFIFEMLSPSDQWTSDSTHKIVEISQTSDYKWYQRYKYLMSRHKYNSKKTAQIGKLWLSPLTEALRLPSMDQHLFWLFSDQKFTEPFLNYFCLV